MFGKFNLDKYKQMKPPSDNSFETMQEIKQINAIPMDRSSVKKFDNVGKTFHEIGLKNNVNIDMKLVNKLIDKSTGPIRELKKYFNRPRPKVMARKINIKMKDYELPSMNTASYPSGHSAQGILISKVLADKYPKLAKKFLTAGKNISDSRRVAKAHYKSDSKLGELMGEDMYQFIKDKV